MSDFWDSHDPLGPKPHGVRCTLGSHLQYTQLVSQAQGSSTPHPLLSLVVIPWHWHLQYAEIFTATGLYLHEWSLSASYSAKPLLLSITSSCFQNQCHWDTRTYCQVWLPAQGATMAPPPLDHSFCVLTLGKHFSEDFASMLVSS